MNQRGFTLFEIILAIALLATLGALSVQLLTHQMNLKSLLSAKQLYESTLDGALKQISDDMSHAYLEPQGSTLEEDQRAFVSKNSVTSFLSQGFVSYLRNSPQSNIVFIRYTLETHGTGNILLRYADTEIIPDPPHPIKQVLASGVKTFFLGFWDGDKFRDSWDSTANDTQDKLPKMIKVQLELLGSTNQPSSHSVRADTIVYLSHPSQHEEPATTKSMEYKWQ